MKAKVDKIIYIPYTSMESGPFKYIEEGIIVGMRAHTDVVVEPIPTISNLTKHFLNSKRVLLVGYLREPPKHNSGKLLQHNSVSNLVDLKKEYKLDVAFFTHPNMPDFLRIVPKEFLPRTFDRSNAISYYSQESCPTQAELDLSSVGFIDIILHFFSEDVGESCFNFWRGSGVDVYSFPLACNPNLYFTDEVLSSTGRSIRVSYVGGCWDYKYQNMMNYVLPLKKEFGPNFCLSGNGWPLNFNAEFVSDLQYAEIISDSLFSLVLHEPSQVCGFPIHVNERIFKVLALGSFPLIDNNPLVRKYFPELADFCFDSGERMVEFIKTQRSAWLSPQMKSVLDSARRRLISEHTYERRIQQLLTG